MNLGSAFSSKNPAINVNMKPRGPSNAPIKHVVFNGSLKIEPTIIEIPIHPMIQIRVIPKTAR
jgi:hypothetical protein